MTLNETVTDVLYLLFTNELIANELPFASPGYQEALAVAQKAGLIVKQNDSYQLSALGLSLVESGKSYDDYLAG